jgi:GNAT superfamily N-acetyltransferase
VTSEIRIRRGAHADLAAILRHRLGMFREMGIGDPSQFDAYASEFPPFVLQAMDSGMYQSWLAETSAGEIVAGDAVYLVPWPATPAERKQQRAFLLNVFTEPAFRRQGIARTLVRTLLDWWRDQGFRSVRLMPSEFGRTLYQSLGFQPTGEMRIEL